MTYKHVQISYNIIIKFYRMSQSLSGLAHKLHVGSCLKKLKKLLIIYPSFLLLLFNPLIHAVPLTHMCDTAVLTTAAVMSPGDGI